MLISVGGFLDQNRFVLLDGEGKLTDRGHKIIQSKPMGFFGEPEEMVRTILWLISSASRSVTGVVVPVDGGYSCYGGV